MKPGVCVVERPTKCGKPRGASDVYCEQHERTARYWERQRVRDAGRPPPAAAPYPYHARHPGDEGGPPRSVVAAAAARDAAVEAAHEASPAEFKRLAHRAVRLAAERLAELTSEDVWEDFDRLGGVRPPEGRAMGHVMLRASREGIIENSGRMTRSTVVEHHRDPTTIWLSLTFGGRS